MALKKQGKTSARRHVATHGAYAERAYEELKQRILSNEFPPGTPVLEQEITRLLGMSRTPVREALIRLQREGLLVIKPRHGIAVQPISLNDMREIYEVLTAVESKAAELLARRSPAPDLSVLVHAVNDMASALGISDRAAFADADARFHRELVDLCGNRRLADIAHVHWAQTQRVRLLTINILPHLDISTDEHRTLLRLIQSGAADEAREAHRLNRERGGKAILEAFSRLNLNLVA